MGHGEGSVITCIVGSVDHGRVMLGCDSMYCEGDDVLISSDPKAWRAGDWVIGAAGMVSWMDLLSKHMRWPKVTRRTADTVVRVEVPREIRRVAQETGTDLEDANGAALVGVHGRLYMVDSDLVVVSASEGYAAIGSGRQPAIGALYATRRAKLTQRTRMRMALESSERYCASVRRPWRWVSV